MHPSCRSQHPERKLAMDFIVGIFFLGLTVTMIVGKGILMSHEFAKTDFKQHGGDERDEENTK